MKNKFLVVLLIAAMPVVTNAQIGGVFNKAKNKVNQRVDNKIDKAIDQTLDKAAGKENTASQPAGTSTTKTEKKGRSPWSPVFPNMILSPENK
ncbi:MAG: hypothetical protein ABIQ31_20405 [Ferruginibacter sp.]